MKREDVKTWKQYITKVGGRKRVVQVIRPDTGQGFLVYTGSRNLRRTAEQLSEVRS